MGEGSKWGWILTLNVSLRVASIDKVAETVTVGRVVFRVRYLYNPCIPQIPNPIVLMAARPAAVLVAVFELINDLKEEGR